MKAIMSNSIAFSNYQNRKMHQQQQAALHQAAVQHQAGLVAAQ
jgi:hypothetical protein